VHEVIIAKSPEYVTINLETYDNQSPVWD